jgi:type I pantothenate kinase
MARVTHPAGTATMPSPYVELDREAWARLRRNHPLSLSADDVTRLQGLGDRIDLSEVEEVYLPLSRLLNFYVGATAGLHRITSDFLGESPAKTPFIIGVAGSVAVGKSTTARILAELLRRWAGTPRVDLITTDGFLYPNAELERRGLLQRKGFPESYNRRALLRFVAEVKAGRAEVSAPVYSHLTYDIVRGERTVIRQPDVLIVEGLNVLQAPRVQPDGRTGLAVSDFFDFSVYVDARTPDIKGWYIDRFLRLRETAFADPHSYFHRYAALSDEEARATAAGIWERINEPNLRENVLPTRGRATLVLGKGEDHSVRRVRLRKL